MKTAGGPRANLTIRMPAKLHRRLAEAARRRGLSLNNFLLQAAAMDADLILAQERPLRLTADDAARLLGLLDNPPGPAKALVHALANRQEWIDTGGWGGP